MGNPKLVQNQAAERSTEGAGWTSSRWQEWVLDRVARRLSTFENEPGEMIGAYDREHANIDDYRGREILELLQNADDAGVGYGSNRSLIRCWPEGLCVSNTGIPFSAAGVESLLISNFSPKKLDRSRHIGNRGLGFRAILGWTQTPLILSGNLHLVFSPSLASSALADLVSKSPEVSSKVSEWRRSGHRTPMPVLGCPAVLDDKGKASGFRASRTFRLMWKRAKELREEYDTVVVIPFSDKGVANQVLRQIGGITPELLLFLQHLEELSIITDDENRTLKAERQADQVSINDISDEDDSTTWHIISRRGVIPDGLLGISQRNTPAYEIKIAVSDGQTAPDTLFSYFPTKIRFPYPVVAHVTLELTSNRQNLIDSEANRFLVGRLAEALAAVAEGSITKSDPWRGLRMVAAQGRSQDPMMEDLGFEEALIEVASTKKLIPTRDDKLATASETSRLSVDPGDWLPLEGFEDLMAWTEDPWLKRMLVQLGVPLLPEEELAGRLESISGDLSLAQRVLLLNGLLNHGGQVLDQSVPPPNLLVDESGVVVKSTATAYFPSTADIPFEVPEWMPLRFISKGLVEGLSRERQSNRERLSEDLRRNGFKDVHQYDLRGLARALVSWTEKRVREEREKEHVFRLDCLNALKRLFEGIELTDTTRRDPELRGRVLTRARSWQGAEELYLGDPYEGGALMEALLGEIHPELFAATASELSTSDDTNGWEEFLLWLGVAKTPREENVAKWNQEYFECVRLNTTYPIEFDDIAASEPDDLNIDSMRVTTVEHISDIVNAADAHAIVAWAAVDGRFDEWHRVGDRHARIDARFKVYTYRSKSGHVVPSYVLWLLRTDSWLPTLDGEQRSPTRCVYAKTIGQELQKALPHPALDPDHELFVRLGVDRESLRIALTRLGVRLSLDDLSWEQCYRLLIDMPEMDPDGKVATRVYRMISEKREEQHRSRAVDALRNEFMNTGELWCINNGTGSYVPVRDGIHFAADSAIPQAIVDALPTLDLPKGRATEKIERTLGAKALRSQDISIEIADSNLVPNSEILNDQLEKLKPYVLALRLDATPDVVGIGRFRKLTLVPCSMVRGKAVVHEETIDFRLEREGDLLISDDAAFFIMPTATEPTLENQIIARYVGNALSAVLQVERASDFAYLAVAATIDVRTRILTDILGHDARDVLMKAREVLDLPEEIEESEIGIPDLDGIREAVKQESSRDQGDTVEDVEHEQRQPTSTSAAPAVPGQVGSVEVPRDPAPPKREILRRVHATRSPTSSSGGNRRITDGDRCEELAERFEESQGRCPLRVASLQGQEGFGCDILSFVTKSDLERFVQESGRPHELIHRFIEVKGRSSSTGAITLAGNELRAARQHKSKYFIYRIYEIEPGDRWEVVELSHPLSFDWDVAYSVDLFRCTETRYWAVDSVK